MVTALAVADCAGAVGGEVAPAEGFSTAFTALVTAAAVVLAAATLRTREGEFTTAA